MDISSILLPSAVKVLSAVSSKKRLLQELGDIASGCYGFDATKTTEALLDRESLGPTGVGNGIALPHARLPLTEQMAGVFVRIERPVEFDAVDRKPVDLVFSLFAPNDAGVEHLKALALVSRTMRDSGMCAKLRANSDPVTLHTILTEQFETKAA